MSVPYESLVAVKARQGWTEEDFQRVVASYDRCNMCRLCKQPETGYVNVKSRGSRAPDILVVGEAPGYEESRYGQAFIGPAAEHGIKIIESVGIDINTVRFTNTTRCFPHEIVDGARVPSPRVPDYEEETVPCLSYLYDEIAQLKPKVIIALGGYASQILLQRPVSITKMNATLYQIEMRDGITYPVIPCIHFSADLRGGGKHRDAIARSFQLAKDVMSNEEPPVTTKLINSTIEAVSYLNRLLQDYESGKIDKIGFDIEYDVLVDQDVSRGESNRLSSLDLFNPDKQIIAASFCTDAETGYSILLRSIGCQVDPTIVEPLMAKVVSTIPVICHNFLHAEGAWVRQKWGVTPKLLADTMLLSYVLYMKTRSHGLKALCGGLLGWPDWSRKMDIFVQSLKPEERTFRNVPPEMLGRYSAIDPVASMALYNYFLPQLDSGMLSVLEKVLHRASLAFLDIEQRGAYLDMEYYDVIKETYPKLVKDIFAQIRMTPEVQAFEAERSAPVEEMMPVEEVSIRREGEAKAKKKPAPFIYNPGSTYQVSEVLYGKFRAPLLRENADKKYRYWGDLSPGVELIPMPGFDSFEGSQVWISSGPLSDAVIERNRVKSVDRVGFTLSTPLKQEHVRPVYLSFDRRSADDKTITSLMRLCLCKCVKNETTKTCDICWKSGVDPNRINLFNFLKLHRDYKKILKVITTYVEPLQTFVIPNTRRSVFNYLLHGTHTGRLASTSINMQNLPWKSDIRRLFVSEWKDQGGLIISLDQSQLEMRLLASESADPLLMNSYLLCPKCDRLGAVQDFGICQTCGGPLGDDFHSATASQIFGMSRDEIKVRPDLRRNAKSISFGIAYGMGARALAEAIDKSEAESEDMIKRFFDKFKKTKKWVNERHIDFKQFGFVRSRVGRKLYLSGWRSGMKGLEAAGERESQNYPIQSLGSDLTLIGMMIAQQKLREAGLKTIPWEFTHDSVEYDTYPGEVMQVLQIARQAMEKDVLQEVPGLRVPLRVDGEIGVRWDGALSLENVNYVNQILTVKGKREWYDETLVALRKTYSVNEEILKEEESGAEQVMDIINRKSYGGSTGGTTTIKANWTLR